MMNVFDQFSLFTGLRPNKSKCEVAGRGVLKGLKMALCGIKTVTSDSINFLKIPFSYNKQIACEENFVKNIV